MRRKHEGKYHHPKPKRLCCTEQKANKQPLENMDPAWRLLYTDGRDVSIREDPKVCKSSGKDETISPAPTGLTTTSESPSGFLSSSCFGVVEIAEAVRVAAFERAERRGLRPSIVNRVCFTAHPMLMHMCCTMLDEGRALPCSPGAFKGGGNRDPGELYQGAEPPAENSSGWKSEAQWASDCHRRFVHSALISSSFALLQLSL